MSEARRDASARGCLTDLLDALDLDRVHLVGHSLGALIAAGPADMDFSKVMGFLAVTLASVNIFGGFAVTERMLAMYKKKERK